MILTALADLVLPRSCVACGRDGSAWCSACRPAGRPLLVQDRATVPVHASAPYDGAVRAALLAYKERGRRDLATPLGALLARAVVPAAGAVLVPVPSDSAAARARGGDHLLRLAARAARASGRRVRPALHLRRAVADSVGLTGAGRVANVRHALRADPPPPGGTALVVDDIVTSGATVTEAVRALRVAGWAVSGAAVIGVTPLRRGTVR